MGTRRYMLNVLDKGFVELTEWMGNDNTVVSSARVSHLGESKGIEKDKELIKYLVEHDHTSPFEQVEFRFRVKCPLFVARQWMRHRTWSYNEASRRYTSENIDFYIPEVLHAQSSKNKQAGAEVLPEKISKMYCDVIKNQSQVAFNLYEYMLYNGVSREEARMILPLNMYTTFYGKVNLHNLLHFLKLRDHPDAQREIRLYAQAIKQLISPIVPISMEYWNMKNNGQL